MRELARRGAMAGAGRVLATALAARPESIALRYNLGVVYLHLDDLDRAEETYGALVKLHPSYAAGHVALGEVHYRRALIVLGARNVERSAAEAALAAFERAIALEPGQADVHVRAGVVHESLRDFDAAAAAFRRAAELRPQDARTFVRLADALLHQGQLASARKAATRAVALAPQDAEAHLQKGRVLTRESAWGDAADALARSVQLDATVRESHYELAVALRHLGRVDEARAQLAEYERLSAYRDALDPLQARLRMRPDDLDARTRLGLVLAAAGSVEAARATLRQVLAADPAAADARRALEALAAPDVEPGVAPDVEPEVEPEAAP
jgi:tetratricopeptide (TPR) repeat protein